MSVERIHGTVAIFVSREIDIPFLPQLHLFEETPHKGFANPFALTFRENGD
jgi:hypothetical protein